MRKIALCDGSRTTLDEIQNVLTHRYEKEVQISAYPSGRNLLQAWQRDERKKADIIIMEIGLDEENGIGVARQVRELFGDIRMIFTTAFLDCVEDIFEADPVGLLVKPVRQERLCEAVERALGQIEEKESQMVVLTSKSFIARVRAEDICYVESERRVLTVHSLEEDIRVNMKLSDLEESLPDYFIRTHQSYLVNMRQIRRFSSRGVELQDGRNLPVSRPRYAKARESFWQFLNEKE